MIATISAALNCQSGATASVVSVREKLTLACQRQKSKCLNPAFFSQNELTLLAN
jgi:hypothetical protein